MEPFKNEKRTEGTSRPRPFASLQDALRAAQPSAGRLAARHAAGDGVALEPKVAAVIASFEDLFVEETFDPASLVREFRIACADHAMFYIGPAVTLASRTAPGVTFRLSPNGDDWVVELQRGDLGFLNNLATEVGGCFCDLSHRARARRLRMPAAFVVQERARRAKRSFAGPKVRRGGRTHARRVSCAQIRGSPTGPRMGA